MLTGLIRHEVQLPRSWRKWCLGDGFSYQRQNLPFEGYKLLKFRYNEARGILGVDVRLSDDFGAVEEDGRFCFERRGLGIPTPGNGPQKIGWNAAQRASYPYSSFIAQCVFTLHRYISLAQHQRRPSHLSAYLPIFIIQFPNFPMQSMFLPATENCSEASDITLQS